jgi:hypothetical protein
MLFSGMNLGKSGENLLDLMGQRPGAKIVVMGFKTQQRIPHATAYGIARVAGFV